MPIAAVASVRSFNLREMPKSHATDLNPIPWLIPLAMPPSSASPELRATVVWVEDQCLRQCVPRMATPPDVLRRVTLHPAKSVSTFTIKCSGVSWYLKAYTSLGTLRMYRTAVSSFSGDLMVGVEHNAAQLLGTICQVWAVLG